MEISVESGMDGEAIFHFLLSLAYPIDRLDWALLSVVILFHHLFPLLQKVEIRAFILPRNFPAVLIIFTGRGGAGNSPPPHSAGRGGEPPLPRGAGRSSLAVSILAGSIWVVTSASLLTLLPRR